MSRGVSPFDREQPDPHVADAHIREIDSKQADRSRIEKSRLLRRERSPQPVPDQRSAPARSRDGRTVLYERDRGYRFNESQIRSMTELGKFRVIAAHDLLEYAYRGNRDEASRDIGYLVRLGIARRGTFDGPEASPRELLTLTKRGHRLVARANRLVPSGQAIYHGFVKRREANHDADLYRLFQKEAARIAGEGGRTLRVILDYELKRRINRDIARFGADARPEIAARHGLEVVRNKIPVPDLRIEYETRDGEIARVNLELVTEHYRWRHIAEKVRAGFSLYTPRGEADRLRRVLDQRELTADILSL
jgi:hypothetical protein